MFQDLVFGKFYILGFLKEVGLFDFFQKVGMLLMLCSIIYYLNVVDFWAYKVYTPIWFSDHILIR